MFMSRIVTFAALFAGVAVNARKCVSTTTDHTTQDCSVPVESEDGQTKFAAACFRTADDESSAGCIPVEYAELMDGDKPGCNDDACWCSTDNCNTKEAMAAQRKAWVPPPMCYGGIAGANPEPYCARTPLNNNNAPTDNDCRKRGEKQQCEEDGKCMFNDDAEEWEDSCGDSVETMIKHMEWMKKVGTECERRVQNTGCFENNEWGGGHEDCTVNTDEASCKDTASGDHCSDSMNGVCSGDAGCEGKQSWDCRNEELSFEDQCQENDKAWSLQPEITDCSRRIQSGCFQNNEWAGMGDGCSYQEWDNTGFQDEGSCTGHRQGERNKDDTADGTANYCQWIAPEGPNAIAAKCTGDDDMCSFEQRDEGGELVDRCENSEAQNARIAEYAKQMGKSCRERTTYGCFDNNDLPLNGDCNAGHWDGTKMIKQLADEASCIGYINNEWGERDKDESADGTENHCQWIPMPTDPAETCRTNGAGTEPDLCTWRVPLTCTFEKQCCKWEEGTTDPVESCATEGAGTMAGMCKHSNGDGPPSADMVQAGFEHQLFSAKAAMVDNKCSMVASFRKGKGSASALGANVAGLVENNCGDTGSWEELAEHIGHSKGSIEEYCTNFVPEQSAMAALKKHSPSEIIAAAKSGDFATIFPGLADNLFIVTKKPEFGECLFTAGQGDNEFGLAICTCEGSRCNNYDALEFIVDRDVGPMRLLQFIDGSLLDIKDAVNGVVDGLLQADGKINAAAVAGVTKEDIATIMKVKGMSDKTSADEMWGLVQDFANLQSERKQDAEQRDPVEKMGGGGTDGGGGEGADPTAVEKAAAKEKAQALVNTLQAAKDLAVDALAAAAAAVAACTTGCETLEAAVATMQENLDSADEVLLSASSELDAINDVIGDETASSVGLYSGIWTVTAVAAALL